MRIVKKGGFSINVTKMTIHTPFKDETDGPTREELFLHLKEGADVLRSENLEQAFRDIDRADFVLGDYLPEAYEDYPLPISSEATISQPTTVAFMLEILDIEEGDRVLDVGSGSGWTTALIAHLVGEEGSVLGLEIDPDLVNFGKRNIEKYGFSNVAIVDTRNTTLHEEVFNKILVSAELTKIPEEFIRSLSEEGLILAPIGSSLILFRKRGDELIEEKRVEGFAFVPYKHISE
jgi:protein-L-isoaspartate(D-aspartate) O-methyltransferase